MRRRKGLTGLFLLIGFSRPVAAQEENVLQARAVFTSGTLVEIDHGQESGVEPGDPVFFRPLGDRAVRGVVQSVQSRSSTVLLQATGVTIEIGTLAEVTVGTRLPPPIDPEADLRDPGARLPSAPPEWSSPEGPFDSSKHLLSEMPRPPEERISEWSGRTFLIFDTIHERGFGTSVSTFARSGGSLRGENPLGYGGEFRFEFDLDLRKFSNGTDPSERETAARVERFSYARGGDRKHPVRWQAGRFLPREFPEFGVLDGVGISYRMEKGSHVGATAGFLPEPGQDYRSGDDFQLAVTYRDSRGEQQQLQWAIGLQKSWHEGVPDRDLGIVRASFHSDATFSWTNTAWIDFYSSADTAKGSGPEISLWSSTLNWSRRRSGSSLGFRHWELPQLLRFQGGSLTFADQVAAGTSRMDGSSWMRLGQALRLSASGNLWRAETRRGSGGDLRLDYDELLGQSSRSWASIYVNDGSDNHSAGLRVGQGVDAGPGRLHLTWDGARFRPLDREGSLTQQDLRVSWDYWSPSRWNLSMELGKRFGGDQDSYSLSLFLQRSF